MQGRRFRKDLEETKELTDVQIRTRAIQCLDRVTAMVVRKVDKAGTSKSERQYTAKIFDSSLVTREMLQCWNSKAIHQTCLNSITMRLNRMLVNLKASRESERILGQKLKMRVEKSGNHKNKWKIVYFALQPEKIVIRESDGSRDFLEVDRIVSIDNVDADLRADFQISFGAEMFVIRCSNVVQRNVWIAIIRREMQKCSLVKYIDEQNLRFKETVQTLMKGYQYDGVRVNDEYHDFLFADYSEFSEGDFIKKLEKDGMKGTMLEGIVEQKHREVLSSERIGTVAFKWSIQFEFSTARRMIVTQKEGNGGQFAFLPEEIIGVQHNEEKLTSIIRVKVQEKKMSLSIDFPSAKGFNNYMEALNWFCYVKPLKQFLYQKLLSHLSTIQYVNDPSFNYQNSIHWLIKTIYMKTVWAASQYGNNKIEHHLIQVLYTVSKELGDSDQDEKQRLKILVSILKRGTLSEVDTQTLSMGKLLKNAGKNPSNCTCSSGFCVLFLARVMDQVNGSWFLEQAIHRKSDTALWALKALFSFSRLRRKFDNCLSPIGHKKTVILEHRTGHPFEYYLTVLPKISQRVIGVIYNIIMGKWSIDMHKKINEAITPEIENPNLIPFLFARIMDNHQFSKMILEKFANAMVGKVENAIKLTRIPGTQAWFFPFLFAEIGTTEEQIHIIRLAVVNIASIIAYDVLGNLKDISAMESWCCARVVLRFTRWNEKGRDLLKMILASAGLIVSNKVKDYMKKNEEDPAIMWKKLSRFYFVYCELILNMPARYALELGPFKVAVERSGKSLDSQFLSRVIEIGVKIKTAMGAGSKKIRGRARFTTMLSFLENVRNTMEKKSTISGEIVSLFNKAMSKLNRSSITMSDLLKGSIKNAVCSVTPTLAIYSRKYFEEKGNSKGHVRRKTKPPEQKIEIESSEDDDEPPPPPPKPVRLDTKPKNIEETSSVPHSGDMLSYGKSSSGVHEDAKNSVEDSENDISSATVQMYRKVIANLREKVKILQQKEKKALETNYELQAELRQFRAQPSKGITLTPRDRGIIFKACRTGDIDLVRKGLQKGMITEVDRSQRGPLHHAVCSLNEEVIQTVLDAKADVNANDNINRTPLHTLVQISIAQNECIKRLIQNGANKLAKDVEGLTALDMAIRNQKDIIHTLKKVDKNMVVRIQPPKDVPDTKYGGDSMLSLNAPRKDDGRAVFDDGFWGKGGHAAGQNAVTSRGSMPAFPSFSYQEKSESKVESQREAVSKTPSNPDPVSSLKVKEDGSDVFDGGFWGKSEPNAPDPQTPAQRMKNNEVSSAGRPLPPPPLSDENLSTITDKTDASGNTGGSGRRKSKDGRPIPPMECADDIHTQCQTLLEKISSSGIFESKVIQATMGSLQNLIEKCGDLHDAMLMVDMCRLMGGKYEDWEELQKAVDGVKLKEFRKTLVGPIRETLKRGAFMDEKEVRHILVLASQNYIEMFNNILMHAMGRRSKRSLREIYWSAREQYERVDKKMEAEGNSTVQYLRKSTIFSRQVKLYSEDINRLVKTVLLSKQGIQDNRTMLEALTIVSQGGQKFKSLRELASAVSILCNK